MPRRVYTYPEDVGWDELNLVSTIGAFLLAAGILVFLIDLLRHLRPTLSTAAGNIWKAGTLDWLGNELYGFRSVPRVTGRYPVWEQPQLEADVTAGRYYLPGTATGWRETIVTSPIEAAPQYLLRLPGPGWSPLLAALFTAAFFMLLTVKLVVVAAVCGFLAVAMIVVWMWGSDPSPVAPVYIGGGTTVPTYAHGPQSHSWWATVVLILVAASLYLSYAFSYLYLWTVSPQVWPNANDLPTAGYAVVAATLLFLSSGLIIAADKLLARNPAGFALALSAALLAICLSLVVLLTSNWEAGIRPAADGHAAMLFLGLFLQLQLVVALGVMTGFTIARLVASKLDSIRRATFDSLALLWHYTVAQGAITIALIDGFPRLIA
jgi:cytochrome c oxidase subunit I+III